MVTASGPVWNCGTSGRSAKYLTHRYGSDWTRVGLKDATKLGQPDREPLQCHLPS